MLLTVAGSLWASLFPAARHVDASQRSDSSQRQRHSTYVGVQRYSWAASWQSSDTVISDHNLPEDSGRGRGDWLLVGWQCCCRRARSAGKKMIPGLLQNAQSTPLIAGFFAARCIMHTVDIRASHFGVVSKQLDVSSVFFATPGTRRRCHRHCRRQKGRVWTRRPTIAIAIGSSLPTHGCSRFGG